MLFQWILVVQHLELLRANQPAVAPRQAHSLAARLVDQANNVLLHLPGQHPFDNFHGFVVGHPHTLYKLAFFTQAIEGSFNLRSTAMHHDRVHAHQFEQHHVFSKISLQRRVRHGVATIFDNHRLAMKLANIGQRLGEYFSLVARADMG